VSTHHRKGLVFQLGQGKRRACTSAAAVVPMGLSTTAALPLVGTV